MKPGEKKPPEFRDNGLPGFAPVFDYSYDGVMRSLEHSHLRLGLAKIDIALVHDVDFWTTRDRDVLNQRFKTVMDSGFKALDELRKAGIISAIGVGINESDTSLRFIKAGDFDCMLLAGRYTLLEQESTRSFLPLCERRGIGIVLGGPYNSGILASGAVKGAWFDYAPASDAVLAKVAAIEEVCSHHNVPLKAAALQFPLYHPCVASVIPGTRSPAELAENLRMLHTAIPVEFWRELKSRALVDRAAPTS
jgi:D-threo-aldose 1-dehydrogenase